MNNRFKNKMNRIKYGHNNNKKKLYYLPVYYAYRAWYGTIGAIITAWETTRDYIKYKYYSSKLWYADKFNDHNDPFDIHTPYGYAYKAKTKLEYTKYYKGGRVCDYGVIFNSIWDVVSKNSINRRIFELMMQMNLRLSANSALSSMCGVQHITHPKGNGLVYMLRYTQETPPEVKKIIEDGVYDGNGVVPILGSGGYNFSLEVLSNAVLAKDDPLEDCAWQLEAMSAMDSMYAMDLQSELLEATIFEVDKQHVKRFCDMVVSACEHIVIECSDKQAESMPFVDDAFMAVMCRFNVEANNIARLTRRGAGNTLWVSPNTLNLLEKYAPRAFAPSVEGVVSYKNDVVQFAGTINGFIKVYCTELPDGVDAIIGYKGGSGESDAAIFYAPHAPISVDAVRMNQVTTGPEIGFVSKYDMCTNDIPIVGESKAIAIGKWTDYYRVISIKFDPENYSTKPIELR